MADIVTIDTSQLDILQDFFDDLATVDERKIFIQAFRRAAKPLVEASRVNLLRSVDRGNLWRSIGTKATTGEVGLWVGSILNTPYITKKGKLSKVWYGHLIEGGFTKRGGKGRVEGTHWFSNAWMETEAVVIENIEAEWYESIEKFIIKTNNKMK